MGWCCEFRVLGEPEPKGSAKALIDRRTGRAFVVADNARSKQWERAVQLVAHRVRPAQPLDCPVRLEVEFTVSPPLKPKFPTPAVRPDLDKYLRSTGDAMTGVLYVDDSRVVEIVASKRYGLPPGAQIRVTALEADQEELPL